MNLCEGNEPAADLTTDCTDEFIADSAALNFQLSAVSEWLQADLGDPGVQIFSDDEICEMARSDTADEIEEDDEEAGEDTGSSCPISHSEAAIMLERCLTWLEYQSEASVYKTSMLRELRSMAIRKRVDTRNQSIVMDYFSSLTNH